MLTRLVLELVESRVGFALSSSVGSTQGCRNWIGEAWRYSIASAPTHGKQNEKKFKKQAQFETRIKVRCNKAATNGTKKTANNKQINKQMAVLKNNQGHLNKDLQMRLGGNYYYNSILLSYFST